MNKRYLVIAVLAAVGMISAAASAETVLGQLAMTDARIDGIPAPTGTTVLSPSTVQAGDRPSVVHLANGGQVFLGRDSGAVLAAGEPGVVKIEVVAGLVQHQSPQGEVTTLAPNSSAEVDGAGEVELDPDLKVCVLDSPGENTIEECAADHGLDGCDWDPTKAEKLEEGDIYFIPSAEDEDEDCRKGIAAWVWGGAAAVALVLSDDDSSSDDPVDVSPSVP